MLCEILFSFCLLYFHLHVFYIDFSHELGDFLSIFLFLPCHLHLRVKSTLCSTLVRIMWMWQELMHGWVLVMSPVLSHVFSGWAHIHCRCLCWFSLLTTEYVDNSQVLHYHIHFYTCAAKALHPCWDPPCFQGLGHTCKSITAETEGSIAERNHHAHLWKVFRYS